MRLALKLSDIDQEHLQELYDAAGVARDELPYSPAFEQICQGFQDRTFKNAEPEQVFGAILKYTRSSSCSAADEAPVEKLNAEQLKQLKGILPRFAKGGKVLPYSSEFDEAKREFEKLVKIELTNQEFWQAIIRVYGSHRRPPKRTKVVVAKEEEDDGE